MVLFVGKVLEEIATSEIIDVVKPFFKGVGKMGEVRINLSNFVVVGLMAFVAVWAVNKGLGKAGMSQYQA